MALFLIVGMGLKLNLLVEDVIMVHNSGTEYKNPNIQIRQQRAVDYRCMRL